MSINEKATTTVEINGEQARQELDLLKREAVAWRNKMVEASEAGDTKGFKKAESELRKVNAQMRTMQKSAFDINNVLNNLSTSGPKDLQRALKAINTELNSGRVQRGSEEWKKYNVQAKQVSAELRKINAEQRESVGWFSRLSDGFNKYFGVMAGAVATMTGFTMTSRKCVDAYVEMEEAQSQVVKYTGMSKESVQGLNEEFKKIDTRTARERLNALAGDAGRLGIQTKEEILDFVDAADKINVALGEDLGEDAVKNIGKLAMMFGEDKEKGLRGAMLATGSAVNELAQNSSAAEPYLVAFTARVAGTANQAKISQANILGYASVLDQNMLQEEMAATAFQALLMKMYQDPAKFAKIARKDAKEFTELIKNDANEAMLVLLESLNKKGGMDKLSPLFKEMGTDGARAAGVISALAKKIDDIKNAQVLANGAYNEGTSIINEFNVQNSTVKADLEKRKKDFKDITIGLGEKLLPVMKYTISSGSAMIKILAIITELLIKHGATLIYVGTIIGSYIALQKINTLWTTNFKNATLLSIAAQKLKALADKAVTASTLLYSAATYALKGNTDMAKQATVAFFKVLKLNPYAAILTVIVAIVGAFYLLTRRTDAQTKAMQSLEKIRLTSIANTSAEKTQVESLLKISRDEALSKAERLRAISKLNQISPEYLGNLTLETINTEKAKKAVDSYIESIQRKARVQATESRLIEVESQILELEKEDKDRAKGDSFWGTAKNVGWMLTGGLMDNNAEKIKKDIYALKTESLSLAKLIEDINKEDIRLDPSSSIRSLEIVNKELEEAQKRLKELKSMTTSQRSKLDYKKELADAKEKIALLKVEKDKLDSGDSDWDGENQDENKAKKALKAKIEKYEEETMVYKASITAMYTAGRITRKEHDDFIEDADRKLLSNKMTLNSKKSSEYHDLLIKLLNMEIKAQEVCAKETIAEIEEGIEKEKRLLFDKYTDQTLSKKAYDEGILRLDRDALVRKQAQYASNSDEFRDYQRRIEEFDAKDKEKRYSEYENRLAEFRKEYQKKTLWELHKEELDRLDELLKVKAIKIEEYEKMKLAIENKYAGLGVEEPGIMQKASQKTTDILNRAKSKAKNTYTDEDKKKAEEGDPFFTMFGAEAKERKNILSILDKEEEDGVISHKEKLMAKAQLDGEYYAGLAEKMQAAYAVISAVTSAYSEYSQASQELEEAKINKKYDAEIKAAGNSSVKKKQIEERKEKELAKVKSKYADRTFAMNVSMGIAQTAIAGISAYASALQIGGLPGLILAPIAASMAVAAGMLQVATLKKQHEAAKQGYYTGGFTPSGRWDEEQGSVHSDEFIANRFAVRNKEIRPVLNLIDRAQKNNTIGSLKASDVSRAIQRNSSHEKESGLSSGFSTGQESQDVQYLIAIVSQTASINKKLLERLNEPFVTVNSVDGPHGMQQAFDNYNGIQRNKSRHD